MSTSALVTLAWGVDLGHVYGKRYRLFESYRADQDDERDTLGHVTGLWEVITYGWTADCAALVLARSALTVHCYDEDKSIGDWLNVRLSGDGVSLESQPDEAELAVLRNLIRDTPGTSDRDDLHLTLLALPSCNCD